MKCPVDEISSWWNVQLMKCPVDEISIWWNVQLMKCPLEQLLKMMKCPVDEMSIWWNVQLMRCPVDEMSSWWNVQLMRHLSTDQKHVDKNSLFHIYLMLIYNIRLLWHCLSKKQFICLCFGVGWQNNHTLAYLISKKPLGPGKKEQIPEAVFLVMCVPSMNELWVT
jgi:hypothetical protein